MPKGKRHILNGAAKKGQLKDLVDRKSAVGSGKELGSGKVCSSSEGRPCPPLSHRKQLRISPAQQKS